MKNEMSKNKKNKIYKFMGNITVNIPIERYNELLEIEKSLGKKKILCERNLYEWGSEHSYYLICENEMIEKLIRERDELINELEQIHIDKLKNKKKWYKFKN
jgi:hypothetical protein